MIDWNFNSQEIRDCTQLLHKNAIPYRSGEKWGYVDKFRKGILSCNYDYCEYFDGDYAIYGIKSGNRLNYGLLDKNFKEVIPAIYDSIFQDGNGIVIAHEYYFDSNRHSFFFNLELEDEKHLVSSSECMINITADRFIAQNPTFFLLFNREGSVIKLFPSVITCESRRLINFVDYIGKNAQIWEIKPYRKDFLHLTYFLGLEEESRWDEYSDVEYTPHVINKYYDLNGNEFKGYQIDEIIAKQRKIEPFSETDHSEFEEHIAPDEDFIWDLIKSSVPQLTSEFYFNESEDIYAIISEEQGCGYLSKDKKLNTGLKYSHSFPFKNNLARVSYMRYDDFINGTIDSTGFEF